MPTVNGTATRSPSSYVASLRERVADTGYG